MPQDATHRAQSHGMQPTEPKTRTSVISQSLIVRANLFCVRAASRTLQHEPGRSSAYTPLPPCARTLGARTSAGAAAGAVTGRAVGQVKRWCRAASTAACELATTIAVWPASKCRRPGFSDTPRARMPAPGKALGAWPCCTMPTETGGNELTEPDRTMHVYADDANDTGMSACSLSQGHATGPSPQSRGHKKSARDRVYIDTTRLLPPLLLPIQLSQVLNVQLSPARECGQPSMRSAPMSTQPAVRYSHSQAAVNGSPARCAGSGASNSLNAQPLR